MEIFDISRTLSPQLAAWPGDVGFDFKLKTRMRDGALVNLGSIAMSLHNGSHADARFHFEDDGWTIEQARLENYLGPTVVADLSALFRDGAMPQINADHLASWSDELQNAPRLLLKTNVWSDSRIFPRLIPTIARALPAWLQARGVKLLGLDLPSVDAIDSRDLPIHHALGAAGICIVESLDLSRVAAGRYQLAALPLKIEGGDGSPVRAILWRE